MFWVLQLIMDQKLLILKLCKSTDTLNNNYQWTPSLSVHYSVAILIQNIIWLWVVVLRLSWLLWQVDKQDFKLTSVTSCMEVKSVKSVDISGQLTQLISLKMVEGMSQVPNKELLELSDLKMLISKKTTHNMNEWYCCK